MKKDLKGESNAREISDALPFVEYEIHRQLVNKLKMKGMNAVFGITMTISLADRVIIALASGTAVLLAALPSPQVPRIMNTESSKGHKALERSNSRASDVKMSSQLLKLQSRLIEKIDENREYFGISGQRNDNFCFGEDLIESEMELDLSAGNKVLFPTSPHVIETV